MTIKHKCAGKIWGAYRDVSGRVYACSRNATVKRDGQWYCWQHDPERQEADKKKRRAAEDAKWDKRSAMWARRAHNYRLAALVTPGLAALLGRLANCIFPGKHGVASDVRQCIEDRETARTLAARIKEVLALEGSNGS